jgi:hypothetical protein
MHPRARPLAIALPLCALALALDGCGTATSTTAFKGEQHEVAQTVSNFQSAASAGEGSKICADYLAKAIVNSLGGRNGCESAIKHQLAQVDNLEITIESVTLGKDGRTATVGVKSIEYGKNKLQDIALLKEGGAWKLSGP